MKAKKNIILFVHSVGDATIEKLRKHSKANRLGWEFMLLRDTRKRKTDTQPNVDIIAECDFSKPSKIAQALLPYQDRLLAMTSRGESNISRMVHVIPHVPYLRTPTTQSLEWCTDKLKMRRRLKMYDPKHTPKFVQVRANTREERARVAEQVGFPLIIKPTNLSTSMLVSVCYHKEELERTLRNAFRKIKKIYRDAGRTEEAVILAEEYMEGDMYSIDTYVDSRGTTYHCPLVRVKTGRDRGHDDFYNYLRITPARLKKESIARAQESADNAIHALGLRSTTVHTELMRVDNEWMIIELGARIGGFRHELYTLSCDIDHSLNDVLIRIPKKPSIPKKCKGFAAALRYYPEKEGRIEKIAGIKRIQLLDSFQHMTLKLKVGDRCYFSKNGGKGVFDLTLYNKDRSRLLADIRRIEQLIKVKIH